MSNTSLLPRYPLITAGSPERAWESASVPAAPLGKVGHLGRSESLDGRLDLDISELTDIKVTSSLTLGPAEEDVAGRLHEPVAVDDTLSVVREDALPRISLQDRGARLLDLKNERFSSAGH